MGSGEQGTGENGERITETGQLAAGRTPVARVLGAVVAVVAFVTYSTTLCRTIYWGDGIELTAVASVLGVAHPTGYPLFSLLGKVFAQLPLGTIAFRLNLMSAVAGTVAAVLVAQFVWRLLPLLDLIAEERTLARALFAAAAGWTVAFSRTFWYQAGLTEVYLLNAAIVAGVFLLVLAAVTERSARWFLAACLLSALGLGNHTSAVILIPALAVIGLWLVMGPRRPPQRRLRRSGPIAEARGKRFVRLSGSAIALGVLGLAVYAYMPMRAAKNPPFNWGDPASVRNFLWSVRGGEFRRFYFMTVPASLFPDPGRYRPGVPFDSRTYPPFLRQRAGEWLTWTGDQIAGLPPGQTALRGILGLLVFALACFGWIGIRRGRPILAAFLAIVLGLNLLIIATYSIVDIEGYFLPIHTIVVICVFVLLAWLYVWTEERLLARRSEVLCAAFLLIPAVAWIQGRAFCNHSDYDAPERYGREVLGLLAPGGMILTQGDYDIAPLWYQQIVERRRPDCVVFGSNFLATPGYAKFFEGRFVPPVAARYFEETPREEAYFEALADEIIATNMQRRPVYATWFDPRMGVESQRIEVATLSEMKTIGVPERVYFPQPWIYRLQTKMEVQP